MNRQKRVLAIHDISCIGKCSLTVAIPIISAAELECAVIPTAVLSTHTGEFPGYTFRDLTDDIEPICEHWRSFGIGFDAIYTGYLGSAKQISLVRSIIDTFGGEGKTVFVDPVMADAGRLYANFDMAFVSEMRSLCAEADVITPNLTEAAFLLGGEYRESGYGEEYIKETLGALCELGPKAALLSGIVRGREDRRGVSRTGRGLRIFRRRENPRILSRHGGCVRLRTRRGICARHEHERRGSGGGALYDKKHPSYRRGGKRAALRRSVRGGSLRFHARYRSFR